MLETQQNGDIKNDCVRLWINISKLISKKKKLSLC
jgi:hypothetical protein